MLRLPRQLVLLYVIHFARQCLASSSMQSSSQIAGWAFQSPISRAPRPVERTTVVGEVVFVARSVGGR